MRRRRLEATAGDLLPLLALVGTAYWAALALEWLIQ